jgi:hypothetical protein
MFNIGFGEKIRVVKARTEGSHGGVMEGGRFNL